MKVVSRGTTSGGAATSGSERVLANQAALVAVVLFASGMELCDLVLDANLQRGDLLVAEATPMTPEHIEAGVLDSVICGDEAGVGEQHAWVVVLHAARAFLAGGTAEMPITIFFRYNAVS